MKKNSIRIFATFVHTAKLKIRMTVMTLIMDMSKFAELAASGYCSAMLVLIQMTTRMDSAIGIYHVKTANIKSVSVSAERL